MNIAICTILLKFIFFQTTKSLPDIQIQACGGCIRIMGQICCKLWLHPNQTIAYAVISIAQDIIRSLASRLEMHWDSLVDEESGSSEGEQFFISIK